jgi:uncharacterized protein
MNSTLSRQSIDIQEMRHDIRAVLPDATAAWLFGSSARGMARQDSDIDVAVMFEASKSTNPWQLRQQAVELAAIWGRDVDLVNIRLVPCVLQKEIIQDHQRLFALDTEAADNYELFSLAQYRDYNERFAAEFERIAVSGKVYQ